MNHIRRFLHILRHRPADAVSFSRTLLVVAWIRCQAEHSIWALVVVTLIVLSDVIDGPIARRTGTAGPRGALIDVVCDILVILAAMIAAGTTDPLCLVAAAAMVTNLLSWAVCNLTSGGLGYTRIGRYNGAACYLFLVVLTALPHLGAAGLAEPATVEQVALMILLAVLAASLGENVALALLSGRSGHHTPARRPACGRG
jgi:phosphatidylglycerophosphate synthase